MRRLAAIAIVPAAQISGSTGIAVDATAKTFTNTGLFDWWTQGFIIGDWVTFTRLSHAGNNGTFLITGLSATVLTSSIATGLVTEAAGQSATGTAYGHGIVGISAVVPKPIEVVSGDVMLVCAATQADPYAYLASPAGWSVIDQGSATGPNGYVSYLKVAGGQRAEHLHVQRQWLLWRVGGQSWPSPG